MRESVTRSVGVTIVGLLVASCLGPPRAGNGDQVSETRPVPIDALEVHDGELVPYCVERGDTLSAIARAHGTTVERLLELNVGLDPRALIVGSTLRVPARKPAVRAIQRK